MSHVRIAGLRADLARLRTMTSRREALRWLLAGGAAAAWFGGAGPLPLAADEEGDSAPTTCPAIPQETAGPFPANAVRGPNVLDRTGVVRRDITKSLSGPGEADGVALTLTLALRNRSCSPLAGRAVYVWHCDRRGRYSLYSRGAERESWLRGVQVSDDDGEVTFQTIFPGCYPGRWPHVHFEIYESLAAAARGTRPEATSQLAFPEETCNQVYALASYANSVRAFARTTLARDGVFADGVEHQMPTMSGTAQAGYEARLTIGLPPRPGRGFGSPGPRRRSR